MKYFIPLLILWGLTSHGQSHENVKSLIWPHDKTGINLAESSLAEQNLLADIIKKKFALYAPDSVKHSPGNVRVSFEVDTDGTLYNLISISYDIDTDGLIFNVISDMRKKSWLIDLVKNSIKELPNLSSDSQYLNGFTDAIYTFDVSFPDVHVFKSTTLEYINPGGAAFANGFDSYKFDQSQSGSKKYLPAELIRNFRLNVPDSLKGKAWTVRATYDIDATGMAKNILVEPGGVKQFTDLVIQTVKEVYLPGNFIPGSKGKCTLWVPFPSLNLGLEMTLEKGYLNHSMMVSMRRFLLDKKIVADTEHVSEQTMIDSLRAESGREEARRLKNLPEGSRTDGTPMQRYFKSRFEQTSMTADSTMRDSVAVRFDVDENGNPSNVALLAGNNKKLIDLVIDCIIKYDNWGPASRNGKVVKTIYWVSINFPAVLMDFNAKPIFE